MCRLFLTIIYSMKKSLLFLFILILLALNAGAQPVKSTESIQQLWFGYFNQTRFSNKWGAWTDLHLRTKENFTTNFSQAIVRLGLTWYLNDNTKFTIGYAYVSLFPGDNHKKVTEPEHRPWQQLQWHSKFTKTRMMQWIRLEERYRRKIANDSTLGSGYNFNFRLRYNIWYEVPLGKKGIVSKSLSFIANDEVHINFGKEIVYNYFDQNRFFLGFKYQFNEHNNVQFGYMNVFQQLAAGNKYKSIHAGRIFYFHNLDLRRKQPK
jgi:Protein of unknown function (DUF2490)